MSVLHRLHHRAVKGMSILKPQGKANRNSSSKQWRGLLASIPCRCLWKTEGQAGLQAGQFCDVPPPPWTKPRQTFALNLPCGSPEPPPSCPTLSLCGFPQRTIHVTHAHKSLKLESVSKPERNRAGLLLCPPQCLRCESRVPILYPGVSGSEFDRLRADHLLPSGSSSKIVKFWLSLEPPKERQKNVSNCIRPILNTGVHGSREKPHIPA